MRWRILLRRRRCKAAKANYLPVCSQTWFGRIKAAKQIFVPSYCGSCLRTDLAAIGVTVLLNRDCMYSKSRPQSLALPLRRLLSFILLYSASKCGFLAYLYMLMFHKNGLLFRLNHPNLKGWYKSYGTASLCMLMCIYQHNFRESCNAFTLSKLACTAEPASFSKQRLHS